MVFNMSDAIQGSCRTILIVGCKLKTIQVRARIKCLITVEALVVHYINGLCIEKTADSKPVFKNTFEFKIDIVPKRKLPFGIMYIGPQQIRDTSAKAEGKGRIFGSECQAVVR